MPLPEKIDKARQSGYSDAEIADFLVSRGMVDASKLATARASGYSDAEVLSFLQGPSGQPVDSPERRAAVERLRNAEAAADQAGRRLKRTEAIVGGARQVFRGAVDLADGVLAVPRLVASAPVAAYNFATGSNVPLPISQSVADINPTSRGLLAPRNDSEQLATTVTRGLGGVLFGGGLGGALGATGGVGSGVANVGRTLASNPGLQTAGAVTGGTSAELARRGGAGAIGQTVAGLAGGVVPSLATAGTQAGTRLALRGGEAGRQRVQQNLETFARAGTTPTVGQATESRTARAAEQLLAQSPGGSGAIIRKAEGLADDLAGQIEQNAARLAGRTSAEQAGRKISSGITGQGGFLDSFRTQQSQLYDELDQYVPQGTPVSVANTQQALKRLNQEIPGAERTSQLFANPKLQAIEEALKQDAGSGTLPYQALKELRTLVGKELADATIISDVSKGKLKQLYGALSDDLGGAVANNPAARQAFLRANNYTKAGIARLELLDEVVQKAGGPEAIFKAATSGTGEGATRLRAVLQSLDEDGQKVVTATVLRRLGRATPGQQDDLSDKFSTETFLTNFAKLSPEAKRALFYRYGPRFRQDLDAIAKVASNLRDGSRVFRNPSGTSQAVNLSQTVAGTAVALLTGRLDVASGIVGGVVGANMSARLLTNPNFVRFLAESTKVPASLYTSQLNQLAQLAQNSGDPELYEGLQLLKFASRADVGSPKGVLGTSNAAPKTGLIGSLLSQEKRKP